MAALLLRTQGVTGLRRFAQGVEQRALRAGARRRLGLPPGFGHHQPGRVRDKRRGVLQARRQRGEQDRAQRIVVIVGAELRQAQDVGGQRGAVVQHADDVAQLAGGDRAVGRGAQRDADLAGAPERDLDQAAGRHGAEFVRQAIVEQPVQRRIERDLKNERHVSGES
jgi:hypothetical protein